VRATPLPPEQLLQIGQEIAAALEAAHARGIIHRDLKPQNVKLTPGGSVKVLDFGLAKPADPPAGDGESEGATIELLTQAGQITGTPGFMSPEQIRGLPQDARTDPFSYGCVLYYCAAGRPPFRGATAVDCAVATLTQEPDFAALPEDTPAAVSQVIRRCLVKDPQERLASASQARAILATTGTEGRPAPGAGEVSRPVAGDLPRPLTSFVGRTREVEEITGLCARHAVVTLTGVGGCGKTRLAQVVAASLAESPPQQVWWVDLASLRDPEQVLPAVFQTLGMREERGRRPLETLIRRLQEGTPLLVLDNCEHLLDRCAELTSTLSRECRELRILTTSREPLGVEGEWVFQVPPLSLGGQGPPATSVETFGETLASGAEGAPSPPLAPFQDEGTTAGYRDDYDESCPDSSASPDVVYFLPNGGGQFPPVESMDVSLCGA